MTDLSSDRSAPQAETGQMALAIYILHLVGFATGGLTTIVGLILAYASKIGGDSWLNSHYDNAIHIFWKGLFYMVASIVLICACIPLFMNENILGGILIAILGTIASLAQVVWFIVRCVKGIITVNNRMAYPDPESWGF